MGFHRAPIRRLAFQDPELAEWEVDTRVPSIRAWQRVAALTEGLSIDSEADAPRLEELVDIIHGYLVGWNLEDEDGTSVPLTADAIHALDKDATKALLEAWIETHVGVPVPLPQQSRSGVPALPMEPLDPAQAS